ncbi:MAG TPA: CAP domain-containing protein [Bryobacteraceae bacterium]|nr:CAP domain-containing protein [Bryobacteraceae bacterium]HPQ16692.1 CAP domain-containing protein [Bryobacteraceae bacterium]
MRALLLLASCLAVWAGQPETSEQPLAVIERRVWELVNRERAELGLNALEWDDRLAAAAREHAARMAKYRFFSHSDPIRGNLSDRLKLARISWRKAAENLYAGKGPQDLAQAAVEGWMKSPGHRQNALDRDLNRAGTGATRAPDGTVYLVQIYIRR